MTSTVTDSLVVKKKRNKKKSGKSRFSMKKSRFSMENRDFFLKNRDFSLSKIMFLSDFLIFCGFNENYASYRPEIPQESSRDHLWCLQKKVGGLNFWKRRYEFLKVLFLSKNHDFLRIFHKKTQFFFFRIYKDTRLKLLRNDLLGVSDVPWKYQDRISSIKRVMFFFNFKKNTQNQWKSMV